MKLCTFHMHDAGFNKQQFQLKHETKVVISKIIANRISKLFANRYCFNCLFVVVIKTVVFTFIWYLISQKNI